MTVKGSREALEFVTASSGDRETGGLYLVRYSVESGGTLLAERRVLREKMTGAVNRVILLRSVKEINFKYWAPGEPGRPNDPVDSWDRKDLLPSSIEIAVGFEDADSRKWPRTLGSLMTAW